MDSIYHLSTNTGFSLSDINNLSTFEFNRYAELTAKKLEDEKELEKVKMKSTMGLFSMFAAPFSKLGKKK